MAFMLENPASQRSAVENESKVEIALFARLVNWLEEITQKLSEGRSKNRNLSPRSCLS